MVRILRASLTLMILAVPALLPTTGCGDDATAGSCVADDACEFGLVCVNGTCASVECTNSGDCQSTQVCVLSVASQKVCAAAECGCLDCSPCPSGDLCINGQCKTPDACTETYCPGKGCTGDLECAVNERCHGGACWSKDACFENTDCGDGEICDAKACRPCVGDECQSSTGDCTVDGCDAGLVCDATTKTCVDPGPAETAPCKACTSNADCGVGGFKCLPVGGGQFCLPPCGTGDDCETGWTCFGGACSPAGFSCGGCAAEGCPDGQVCDTSSGVCSTPKALCDTCGLDWECGPDAACTKVGSTRQCVPRCSGGEACAAGSTCTADGDSGIKVCKPATGTCCFDPNPANCGPQPGECTPACGGQTPHCAPDKVCVECLNATHCTGGAACVEGFCEQQGGECKNPTPYTSPTTGKCVQCLNTTHCSSGTCDTQTGTCVGDACAQCADPYPACTLVGGDYYCVQCTTNEQCGVGGTCDLQTYSCTGGTVTPTEKCKSDADCDPGITSFTLKCDVGTGMCYDIDGACDNVTAFCKSGPDACKSFFEAFAGAGGMPIPPELLGGATIPGACQCDPTKELLGQSDCFPGVACNFAITGIFAVILGGNPFACGSGGL